MAALSDSRLVWSATLVMVVTTELMLAVFSLRTASLAVIELAASMIWRMVDSMCAMAVCPLPASSAVSSATWLTSLMVLTSSFEVTEICLEVAPISAVVAAISWAVPCCCLAVAADFRRGGIDLDARTLDLPYQLGEIVRQAVEAIAQDAEFIPPIQGEPFGEIALPHPFKGRHQAVQAAG